MFLKIKDFDDYSINEDGVVKKNSTGRYLKLGTDRDGYKIVGLRRDKKSNTKTVHRLVAITFNLHNPNPDIYTCIDHIDDDKCNNSLSNLQWISVSLNNRKRVLKNKYGKGVRIFKNKYEARIVINGKKIHLGRFDTKEEAQSKYLEEYNNFMNKNNILV